jgi:hypothetical protein
LININFYRDAFRLMLSDEDIVATLSPLTAISGRYHIRDGTIRA